MPLVFVEKIKGAARIVKADVRAVADGLRPGMALADARARVPALKAVALNRPADEAFLAHLAGHCLAFTPSVTYEMPDGLTLDITGCAHLFGGEAGLIARLQMVVRKAGISVVKVAVAPTADMARALARFGKGHPITAEDASQVRPLPVAALECSREDALALRRAGLETISDVADRPSVLFSARFTPGFSTKLARILGEEDQRIVQLQIKPAYVFSHQCFEPVISSEAILCVLDNLAMRAAQQLQERVEGGRVFDAVFFRTDGLVRSIRVETSQATRDPAVVLLLYRDRLDALSDPLDPGFGFDVICLHVVRAEPYAVRQTNLDAHDERQEQFAVLIGRLGAIFGKERVLKLEPIETHTPEHAQMMVPAVHSRTAATWSALWPALWHEAGPGTQPSRPAYLFDVPHPIELQAGTGREKQSRFIWRRMMHEITRTEGPERIAGAWWQAQSDYRTRDYYRVETRSGRRFWIFETDTAHDSSARRWFLHGVFA